MAEKSFEENADFELAQHIIEHTGANLFLTGRAGTGKTTFLHRLIGESRKRMVVAAPTGIAAINAGGVTLHSLFQLDFGPFIPGMKRKPLQFSKAKLKVIKYMDVLVIDEISMVRADLLDAVDDALRRLKDPTKPFGGVQLLLIGDLRQLPPVVVDSEKALLAEHYSTPYFFSSHALAQTQYVTIELQKVFRQEDPTFLNLLNGVRDGHPSPEIINALNKRYVPNFNPSDNEHWVRLTTHNYAAANINTARLNALHTHGETYRAKVSGTFPESSFPAEQSLTLKEGAQVMFIKNDPDPEKCFFNGMIGTVIGLDESTVRVQPSDGSDPIDVGQLAWDNRKFEVNERTGQMEEKIEGTFSQIPLRLAWAITIHKSQGLTFDRAIIDASASFAHGQTYVALSRCRTLEGLVLSSLIPAHAIISDATVSNFLTTQAQQRPEPDAVHLMEKQYAQNQLDALFTFNRLMSDLTNLHKVVTDAYYSTFVSVVRGYGEALNQFEEEVTKFAPIFQRQYQGLLFAPDSMPQLQERLKAAGGYFPSRIQKMLDVVKNIPLTTDNKELRKRLQLRKGEVEDSLGLKIAQLTALANEPFSASLLTDAKARFMLSAEKAAQSAKETARGEYTTGGSRQDKLPVPVEIEDAKLYKALVIWRVRKSKELGLPAYRILSGKALMSLAGHKPQTVKELLRMNGVGPMTVDAYGDELLAILARHKS